MTARFRLAPWLLAALLPAVAAAQDREPGAADTGSNSAAIGPGNDTALGRPADEAREPSFMDLLEFLGEFETEDGRWVDPGQLLDEIETGMAVPGSNAAGIDDDE